MSTNKEQKTLKEIIEELKSKGAIIELDRYDTQKKIAYAINGEDEEYCPKPLIIVCKETNSDLIVIKWGTYNVTKEYLGTIMDIIGEYRLNTDIKAVNKIKTLNSVNVAEENNGDLILSLNGTDIMTLKLVYNKDERKEFNNLYWDIINSNLTVIPDEQFNRYSKLELNAFIKNNYSKLKIKDVYKYWLNKNMLKTNHGDNGSGNQRPEFTVTKDGKREIYIALKKLEGEE